MTAENVDCYEILEVQKVISNDAMDVSRALLWVQEHPRNIPGWFWNDSESFENRRKNRVRP